MVSLPATHDRWWCDSVVYEIYVRSFSDSDGDGVGDLGGLLTRLDYLVDLGTDLVWVTPFHPSPMADFGYDVPDYCDVDPLFGSIEVLERLVQEAHRRGLRIVVDRTPNHCNDQHPSSGEYYVHLFLPEQPDLNWRSPSVRSEFEQVLRFWLDKGIDGFRIDVAHALSKDPGLRDNVQIAPFDWSDPRWAQWNAFEHHHDVCQPETLDIYRTWRELVAEYDAVVIGETYVLDDSQLAGMLTGDGLHFGFWFKPMFIECDAIRIRDVLRDPLASLPDASMIGWVSSGHDDAQPATRFGGGDTGRRRAPAFSTLLFCLPGPPFLYQGEELGLEDCAVPDDARADPVGADVELSRDGCRTPMIWEQGPSLGFSEADETWLPHIGRTDADTASVQVADPESWFHRYRALIDVRKSAPELRAGAVERLDENDGLVSFRRGGLHVALNAGDDSAALGVHGSVVFSTDRRAGVVGTSAVLDPGDAIVVRC